MARNKKYHVIVVKPNYLASITGKPAIEIVATRDTYEAAENFRTAIDIPKDAYPSATCPDKIEETCECPARHQACNLGPRNHARWCPDYRD